VVLAAAATVHLQPNGHWSRRFKLDFHRLRSVAANPEYRFFIVAIVHSMTFAAEWGCECAPAARAGKPRATGADCY